MLVNHFTVKNFLCHLHTLDWNYLQYINFTLSLGSIDSSSIYFIISLLFLLSLQNFPPLKVTSPFLFLLRITSGMQSHYSQSFQNLIRGFHFSYVFLNDCSSILKSLVMYFSWMSLMSLNIMTFTYMYMCVLCHFSHVLFFVTVWTIALQALLSMGLTRQEYWNGLPSPLPRGFPHP